jgi:hypothetical protein
MPSDRHTPLRGNPARGPRVPLIAMCGASQHARSQKAMETPKTICVSFGSVGPKYGGGEQVADLGVQADPVERYGGRG